MKILLLGSNGQLGQELNLSLSCMGQLQASGRSDIDLTNLDSICTATRQYNPDLIVNAAAYTSVDKAEDEPEIAFRVNAEAVDVLASEARKNNSWLIHYSTDYVFDGTKKFPYSEIDIPNPINEYGKSKLAGEEAIINSGCKHLIFRTTWLIGTSGQNFAKKILHLVREKNSLKVVKDQVGVPTTPNLISKVTNSFIQAISDSRPRPAGIYHLSPGGRTTWYEIAQTLINLSKQKGILLSMDEKSLEPIVSSDSPGPAKRPMNSLLNTDKLERCLGFKIPNWEYDFMKIANEIINEL